MYEELEKCEGFAATDQSFRGASVITHVGFISLHGVFAEYSWSWLPGRESRVEGYPCGELPMKPHSSTDSSLDINIAR